MMAASQNSLSSEKAKLILSNLLAAFNSSENASRIEEARENAGSDMLKLMQHVFPLVAQIQMDVIKSHGYSSDGKGAVQFALAVKELEKDDPEVACLNAQVRSYFFPSMIPSQTTPNSADTSGQ